MANMEEDDDIILEKLGADKVEKPINGPSDDEDEDDNIQDWGAFLQSTNITIPGILNDNSNSTKNGKSGNTGAGSGGVAAPVVPRVGDKGFEPTSNNYDNLLLQNKRDIMYATIGNSIRGHHHKQRVEAFYLADMEVCHKGEGEEDREEEEDEDKDNSNRTFALVPKAKGAVFNNLGTRSSKNHIYVSFEEILYLVERGNVECYMFGTLRDKEQVETAAHREPLVASTEVAQAVPMSLQMCYAMFLKNVMDHDMFYVYSYLKRYGYIVRHASESDAYRKDLGVRNFTNGSGISSLGRFKRGVQGALGVVFGFFSGGPLASVKKAVCNSRLFRPVARVFNTLMFLKQRYSWATFYKTLQIIPYDTLTDDKVLPTHTQRDEPVTSNNNKDEKYKIVYNIWKPNNHFRVEQLQRPDFQVIIVNTNYTKLPSLEDIRAIFRNCYSRDRVLLAIVDNGMLNFIKLNASNVGPTKKH